MFTGQLIWTEPSDPASQLSSPGKVANGSDSGAAFALLYTEALDLASEQGPEGSGYELNTYCSSMGRLMSQERAVRSELVPDASLDHPPGLHLSARLPDRPLTTPDLDGNLAPSANSAAALNKSQLAHWMDAHALSRSSHQCALYCRQGMEAAGLSTEDRPRSGDAGDYGPFLLRHGAYVVSPTSYTPQVGDTVVFDKTAQHPNGHIEMYDGHQWVSDFMQHSFSPYRDAAGTPPFTIYRLT